MLQNCNQNLLGLGIFTFQVKEFQPAKDHGYRTVKMDARFFLIKPKAVGNRHDASEREEEKRCGQGWIGKKGKTFSG